MVVGILPLIACVGCAKILGIEDTSVPVDNPGVDAPPFGDGPGPSTACAPLPSFGPVTRYGAANGIALAVGDVNRDAIKDVVVVSRTMSGGDVLIFQGAMNGTLGAARSLHAGTPTLATGALIADVDADGSMDVVTWDGASPFVTGTTSSTVSVHRQNNAAAGTFLAAQSFSVPGLEGVVAAKLNNDPRTDLAIQNRSMAPMESETFPYLASTTTAGTFTKGSKISTKTISHVGDFDQDGLDDLAFVAARITTSPLEIAFNNHAVTPGTFEPVLVGAGMVENASFGHFTGSTARQDVVVFVGGQVGGQLYAQTAPRVFEQRSATVDVSANSVLVPGDGMKTVDVNGDSRDDVVRGNQVEVQCPTAGTFSNANIEIGDRFMPFERSVLTDINGSGRVDLIDLPGLGSMPSSVVEVWLQ